MAAPTLNLEEFQFDDTGVLMNGAATLPFIDIKTVDGLDNAPYRTQTHDQEGMDGGFVDTEFESIRTVTIEGTLYADPTSMETFLDSLKANFAPSKTVKPLYFQTDAGQRLVFGKAQGIRYSKDQMRRLGQSAFQIQFMCEDPCIYSTPLITTTFTRSTGSGSITLSGNRTSPGKLTINAVSTITNPVITHTQSGTVFTFALAVSTGQALVIDLRTHTVILNGTINKRNAMVLTGNWYQLVNGVNNFTLGGTGTTAQLKIEARSAWR